MTIDRTEFTDRVATCRDQVADGIEPILQVFPIAKYIALLDATPAVGAYQYRSAPLITYRQAARLEYPQQIAAYHAVVLLDLIKRSLTRIDSLHLTDEIVEICLNNFARIVAGIEQSDTEYLAASNDRFDKDLAAASLRLICAGAQKIHTVKFRTSLIRRHPYGWIKVTSRIGIGATLYEMHTDSNDPILMAEFNETGWRSFYRRIAELLGQNSVGGVVGTSWFFDPALKEISPRLTYLRSLIVENGGISMRMRTSDSDVESATRTSETRRRLYAEGKYVPVPYTLVWPKRELVAWADSQTRDRQ